MFLPRIRMLKDARLGGQIGSGYSSAMAYPSVSVLLPVYNEVGYIDECLASLSAQDYPGQWEVLVAEGGSTDGTRDRLEGWATRWERLRMIDNPRRVQSHGLNLAAEMASGEVVVRADAHTTYAPDFVRRSVELLLSSDAVAVGGLMRPEGLTPFGRAVALAMSSPLGVGPGRFHYSDHRQEADTAYLPAFRRADFLAAGGYREFPSGAGEDAELHHRWRRSGRKILLDPSIRSTYRPRETPVALWRQFFNYGRSKAEMLYVNGMLPAWRPLAPLALVLGLATTGIVTLAWRRSWPLLAVLATWGIVIGAAAIRPGRRLSLILGAALAVAVMHLAYGMGLLAGLLRGPRRVSKLRAAPPMVER
jgi:succinoglycan biosynthesis protein ExoA